MGVVAYELYAGYLPFTNEDSGILEKVVLNYPPGEIDGVSDVVNSALMKALAKNKKDRFDTCTDFIAALEGVQPVVKEESEEKLSVDQLTKKYYKELKAKQDKEAKRKAQEKIEREKREKREKEEKERKPGTRRVETVEGVDFAFRWCPAGTFMMGSPEGEAGRKANETQHQVTLSQGFWMLETQVTQKQWQAIMGNNPSFFKKWFFSTRPNNPVENVSWNYCQEFCEKFNSISGLKIGLPMESQWEYACRAGTTGAYAGDLDSMSWYGFIFGQTYSVGTKQLNAWGLSDMHGNVWEWCSDWFGDYPSGCVTDPTGASSGTNRVIRGGSWLISARYCRSAYRIGISPNFRGNDLGFRPILVPDVP